MQMPTLSRLPLQSEPASQTPPELVLLMVHTSVNLQLHISVSRRGPGETHNIALTLVSEKWMAK